MKIFRLILILIISGLFSNYSLCEHNIKNYSEREYVPGQLIIKFKKDVGRVESNTSVQSLLSRIRADRIEKAFPWRQFDPAFKTDPIGLTQIYVVYVPITVEIPRLAALVERDNIVEYAEPNYIVEIGSTIPNDPLYSQQSHLNPVKASLAWKISTGDTSVVVAIIDTGVDWDHPDLADAIWRNWGEIPNNNIDDDNNGFIDDIRGWDFVEGLLAGSGPNDPDPNEDLVNADNNPMDYQGHGTHVAGIAGAVTDNAIGIASLAWKCKIMPLRIGWRTNDGGGYGILLWMARAFTYAADNGAHVANLSYGTGDGSYVKDAAKDAYLKGVVICNSAGNSGDHNIGVLSAEHYVLGVAALDNYDVKASFSSYNRLVNISAPGVNILSTIVHPSPFYNNNQYMRFSGTSMSSPLVASLAALLKAQHPDWTPAQIMFQITGTADNIDGVNPAFAGKLGFGRINAYRALTEVPPPAPPKLSLISISIDDSHMGNNNKRIDPGETVSLIVKYRNDWGDATGVSVKLEANSLATTTSNDTWTPGIIKGISNLAQSTVTSPTGLFLISAHPQSVALVFPCTLTLTADGGVKLTHYFDLSISPSVLFVDDDAGGLDGSDVDIKGVYTSTLRTKNIPYGQWDYVSQGSPPQSVLNSYSTVIWGCEWAFPSLTSTDRSRLSTYLSGGGRLFLSGQDIGWDLCDPAEGYPNEYNSSYGASKVWYEDIIRARYLHDDVSGNALFTPVYGVDGDSIGDGLSFTVSLPGREARHQYPDLIQPLGTAKSVFQYDVNKVGAIRYSSQYRLVYLAFGGLEAISDTNIRYTVFDRIYTWLNQRSLTFTKLRDTEDSTISHTVTAKVSAPLDVIQSVTVYWNYTGVFPFNTIPMTDQGNGNYQAVIPAPNRSTSIFYFVVVQTSGGTLPIDIRQFNVGIDNIPPIISFVEPIGNSIKRQGPYSIIINATDNIGVDTSEIYLFYSHMGSADDSVRLYFTGEPDEFSGSFTIPSPAQVASRINYYVRVKDHSSQRNIARLPVSGYASFTIGCEMVDDFERQRPKWDFGTGWGRTSKDKKNGLFSITDSPDGDYALNSNNSLTLIEPLDLSSYSQARLYFWRKFAITGSPRGDTGYVEYSLDGNSWFSGRKYRGTRYWGLDSITLPTGVGAESVRIRFRVLSDTAFVADGLYIDDVEVRVDTFIMTNVPEMKFPIVHSAYKLKQNYPNPFNPSTTIRFDIPKESHVTLKVYNILGQEVATLVNEVKKLGSYEVKWNASRMASGVYFYRLEATQLSDPSKSFMDVKKLILLK